MVECSLPLPCCFRSLRAGITAAKLSAKQAAETAFTQQVGHPRSSFSHCGALCLMPATCSRC